MSCVSIQLEAKEKESTMPVSFFSNEQREN